MEKHRPRPMIQTFSSRAASPSVRRTLKAPITSATTIARISPAPMNITHQSVAMTRAAGPAGSTTDRSPLQPINRPNVVPAIIPRRSLPR